jgi:hypothetical protein
MIGIGIANSFGVNLSGLNPATKSFVTSAGISDANTVLAINNLINGLQADGLWPKMKAIYPFVTDNRNLASYTEDWANAAWVKNNSTITSNAITAPNGTLTADLFQANAAFGNTSLVGVRQTAGTFKTSIYIKGVSGVAAVGSIILGRGMGFTISTSGVVTVNNPIGYSGTNNYLSENVGNGWYRISFDWTYTTGVDGIVIASSNSGDSFYIWGVQCEQSSTLSSYQPIATSQQAYIASQFKFNLKDPRDLDAAFRLVFNGGFTHSRNGAQPNGTNGYAETYFNPVVQSLPVNDTHFSIYSRTNLPTLNVMIGNNAGGGVNQSNIFSSVPLFVRVNSLNTNTTITSTNILGLITASRISSGQTVTYKNNTAYVQNDASNGISNTTYRLGGNLGIINGYYDGNQYAFSSIGNGLTDTEAQNLYTRVQAFQTALSRNV